MPYIDVDVYVDDFLRGCSSREIKELIECLREDGHLPDAEERMVIGDTAQPIENLHDEEWYDTIKKLAGLRLQMTLEDIETIKNITKKY
jgi:hypothetical protein